MSSPPPAVRAAIVAVPLNSSRLPAHTGFTWLRTPGIPVELWRLGRPSAPVSSGAWHSSRLPARLDRADQVRTPGHHAPRWARQGLPGPLITGAATGRWPGAGPRSLMAAPPRSYTGGSRAAGPGSEECGSEEQLGPGEIGQFFLHGCANRLPRSPHDPLIYGGERPHNCGSELR